MGETPTVSAFLQQRVRAALAQGGLRDSERRVLVDCRRHAERTGLMYAGGAFALSLPVAFALRGRVRSPVVLLSIPVFAPFLGMYYGMLYSARSTEQCLVDFLALEDSPIAAEARELLGKREGTSPLLSKVQTKMAQQVIRPEVPPSSPFTEVPPVPPVIDRQRSLPPAKPNVTHKDNAQDDDMFAAAADPVMFEFEDDTARHPPKLQSQKTRTWDEVRLEYEQKHNPHLKPPPSQQRSM